jgi:hypothetical protein
MSEVRLPVSQGRGGERTAEGELLHSLASTARRRSSAPVDAVQEDMLHPRLHRPLGDEDPLALIDAANRECLLAYRHNARLMAVFERSRRSTTISASCGADARPSLGATRE